MREFRKTRIQREVSELLADVDTWNGGAGSSSDLTLRQIGIAFFSVVVGVILGQSVALTALENRPYEDLRLRHVGHLDDNAITVDTNPLSDIHPKLPEIELVFQPGRDV